MNHATKKTQEDSALRSEINRLNKVVEALMDRAERDMGESASHFAVFRTAVSLEKQVQERTRELEAALRENERINKALQQEKDEQRVLIAKLEEAGNQLLQSEKLASIGQLAAGVAHEINNPIAFVTSNLGALRSYFGQLITLIDNISTTIAPLLADQPAIGERIADLTRLADLDYLREDMASVFNESIDGATRVRKIVQDLRDFSRVGNISLEMVDLHAGLESTLNVVANEIKYKADVVREYGTIPPVECRPSQVNQVFMNLLVNAAQAIPQRGQITLRSGTLDDKVWIAISDTGSGIPAEVLPRIFDPFFTTKPVGKGTGLGLSVSYGIMERHGGKIEARSTLGQGSTFTVWLPIQQQPLAAQEN